jgi:hypothetical protein
MNPSATFVKYFGKLDTASAASEEEFRALKHGDRILVKLDGAEPEVRNSSDSASAICSLRQVTWGTITTTFLSMPLTLKSHTPNTIATPSIIPILRNGSGAMKNNRTTDQIA